MERLAPQTGAAEFLCAIDGEGVTVVDPIGSKLLLADEPLDQIDMGLLDLADLDLGQQTKQRVGMGQTVQFGEQQPQVLLEHGPRDLGVGFPP
ncbi:MAG: hypothetical protein MZW92_03630 [Comamonadaceae bacterium]|nr:hypothetical protein [Comamonadaceae bacterium]